MGSILSLSRNEPSDEPGTLQEHGEDEERWLSLGLDKSARLLVVCHTHRDVTGRSAAIRIISARKASRRETSDYEHNTL